MKRHTWERYRRGGQRPPTSSSAQCDIKIDRDKPSESLPNYILSEVDPDKIYRAGYFHVLRNVAYHVARRGIQCNVYFWLHSAAQYNPLQREFNWENGNSPLWTLVTGYREIAREISGHVVTHPQTVKRAIEMLKRDGLIKAACDGRKLHVGIVYNSDFFGPRYGARDNSQKPNVTLKNDPQQPELIKDNAQTQILDVTGCDGNMARNVTPWHSSQAPESTLELLRRITPGVTKKADECDTYPVLKKTVYISPNTELNSKGDIHSDGGVIRRYLASLDARDRQAELKAMVQLQSGKLPWSRAEVESAFGFMWSELPQERPHRVAATVLANRDWLRATVTAFNRHLPEGTDAGQWFERTRARFQARHVTHEDQAVTLKRLREAHRSVLRMNSDLKAMKYLALWLWELDQVGRMPAAPPESSALTPEVQTVPLTD